MSNGAVVGIQARAESSLKEKEWLECTSDSEEVEFRLSSLSVEEDFNISVMSEEESGKALQERVEHWPFFETWVKWYECLSLQEAENQSP